MGRAIGKSTLTYVALSCGRILTFRTHKESFTAGEEVYCKWHQRYETVMAITKNVKTLPGYETERIL